MEGSSSAVFLYRACNAESVAIRHGRVYKHLGLSREESLERSKVCKVCLKKKEARDFALKSASPDGLQPWCRACHAHESVRTKRPTLESVLESQQCLVCGQEKPSADYFRESYNVGLRRVCKLCCKEARRTRKKALTLTNPEFGVLHPAVKARFCARCRLEKKAADFHKNRGMLDGLNKFCRTCMSRYFRTRYFKKDKG